MLDGLLNKSCCGVIHRYFQSQERCEEVYTVFKKNTILAFIHIFKKNLKKLQNARFNSSLITKLNSEELHSSYRSSNIVSVIKSRRLRWSGHVARMEEGRSAFGILTDKPTGKRPLGRPRRR